MKDPAFLFYSKDFYEGTRMMLPEERACYIDLLIYQHQNGIIPKDVQRLTMYCSGCSIETINQVLNQKFKQTDNGWFNQRLSKEKTNRSENKPKKIASATLAGLISSNKLTISNTKLIKSKFKVEDFIYKNKKIKNTEKIKTDIKEWFYKMVNQMVNNNANANANEDVNKNLKKEKSEKKSEVEIYPTGDDFWIRYDKQVGNQTKIKKMFSDLPLQTRLEIYEKHLPEYIKSTPNKKFRVNPMRYLEEEYWNNEIINYNKNEESTKKVPYRFNLEEAIKQTCTG